MFKKSKTLRALRQELEQGTQLGVAYKRVGIKSSYTLLHWRKRPMINRYIEACMAKCEDKRVTAVEDAHFKAAIEGNVRAQENFLFNRAPNRWKRDNGDLIHKGEGGVNVNVNVYPDRVMVFRDLKLEKHDRANDSDAPQGSEGNRIEGTIQGP